MTKSVEKHIIGSSFSADGSEEFFSINPSTGNTNSFSFTNATEKEINSAAELAEKAFNVYRKKSGTEKATFLEAIGDEIMAAGDELVTVCMNETALPKARIENERGRTVNQLKMFAALLREGAWVDARIDTAIPDRAPVPKPDLRYMQTPLGPVVVFGASNFPLAFSVAGGDTASALAAGCPVIVKAHPAHPATSAIVGKAIQSAAIKTNMPEGVFSLLFDSGIETGMRLVQHPLIKAVGFTGSFKAGKAIYDAAVRRPEPIPVYAEMGSTNPVFILPNAMKEKGESIAQGFAASVTLGVGQFCTNPGLLIYQNENENFFSNLQAEFKKTSGGVMLTKNIAESFSKGIHKNLSTTGVEKISEGNAPDASLENIAIPLLMSVSGNDFSTNEHLAEEVFGPSSIAINTSSKNELLEIASNLSGHLTATIFATDDDLKEYSELITALERKVGRLIFNNFPTGVEVCNSMVHGGPYPSTTDSRTTSVGTAAIYRFTRPICYQNMPQALLPEELKNENILKLIRIINGVRTNDAIN